MRMRRGKVNPMRRMPARVVCGIGLLLVTAGPLMAHHSFVAEFDVDRPVTLRGTIAKMEWINPHAWIHMEVKRPDGTVEQWAIELGTPNTLIRRGITRESVTAGVEIVVEGFQARDGTHKANGRNVTVPDGRQLFVGSAGAGTPRDGRDPNEQ